MIYALMLLIAGIVVVGWVYEITGSWCNSMLATIAFLCMTFVLVKAMLWGDE